MRKTAKQVIAEVAARHGMTPADLLEVSQKWKVAHRRQEAMFEMYIQCPHLSFPAIGRALGGMDHTTVMFGVKQHCKRLGITYESIRRNTPLYTRNDDTRAIFAPADVEGYRKAVRVAA